MVFHWGLSDSTSPSISRILHSILAESLRCCRSDVLHSFPFSNFSSPLTNLLVTVPIAPITTGITATFMLHNFFSFLARSIYLSFFSPSSNFTLRFAETAKSTIWQVLFFIYFFLCWLSPGLVVWPRLNDLFIYQNPEEFCGARSPGLILGCVYTTCSYGQISISCRIPSRSPGLPSHVCSYTLSVSICCIRLLCNWSFHLYHLITHIFYFVASYLFLPWYRK